MLQLKTMAAATQTLTESGGPCGGGWGGGQLHTTENKSECYKSTEFQRVTQQVLSSFVSHIFFFIKKAFSPNSPSPVVNI